MFVLGHPDADRLDAIAREQSLLPLTYDDVGMTQRDAAPPGYRFDRYDGDLGTGAAVWDRARDGIRTWAAHRGAGLTLRPFPAPIEVGTTIAQAVRLPLAAAVAPCRIVLVVDEPDAFGFAYGTLPGHPEEGEESFVVTKNADGAARFTITAVSRPRELLARLGAPISRRMQVRITHRYLAAMQEHCRGE